MRSPSLNQLEDFAVLGEATGLKLGIDQVAVDRNLEGSATGFNQFAGCIDLFAEFCRQTGGAWLVVSLNAVFDLYSHLGCSRS